MKTLAWIFVPILLVLETAYFVGTWIFLNQGHLLRLINTDREKLSVEYRYAYSFIPGIVSVRGIRITATDSNMQLGFDLDSVRVRLSLISLRSQIFDARSVSGSGLSFYFRFRRPEAEISPAITKLLPSIPGHPDFIKPAPDLLPPGPWRVVLNGISIDEVREIWLDVVRFRGKAEVGGGFELRPGRGASVFPSYVLVKEGNVSLRGEQTSSLLQGKIEGEVATFLQEEVEGLKIFKNVSGRVQLDGKIQSILFLNHYVRRVKWLRFDGGEGKLHVDLSIDKGMLISGSQFQVDAHQINVHLWSTTAHGDAQIAWKMAPQEDESTGTLSVQLKNYRLLRSGEKDSKIEGKEMKIALTTGELSLSEPFTERQVHIVVSEAKITDFAFFNAYFPSGSGFSLTGGTGAVRGELWASSLKPGQDHGEVHIDGSNAQARFENYRLLGKVKALVRLTQGNIEAGKFSLAGTVVDLSDMRGMSETDETKPAYQNWWGKVVLTSCEMQWKAPAGFRADFSVRGRDARPVFTLFAAQDALPGWVGKILSFEDLNATGRLAVRDDFLEVPNGEVTGKDTSLVGWFRKEKEHKEGRLLLRYGPLAAGFQLDDRGGHVRLEDAIRWYRKLEAKRQP